MRLKGDEDNEGILDEDEEEEEGGDAALEETTGLLRPNVNTMPARLHKSTSFAMPALAWAKRYKWDLKWGGVIR